VVRPRPAAIKRGSVRWVRRAGPSRRALEPLIVRRRVPHHGPVTTMPTHHTSLAGSSTTRSRHATYPGRDGIRQSDRSDVGCLHAKGCPLFPLLNASLRGWRDYYCDSEDRWLDCARYKLSRTGQPVPISLLPNGKNAQHLNRAPDADRFGSAEPRQAPPSRLNPGSPGTTAPFEPAPAAAPARPLEPSPPSQAPQPPAARSTRRWWTRLADWMRGPA
jgi:hypothetical protein